MDLAELIAAGLEAASLELQEDDILVVAQKIVSKAEGRMVRLADVVPTEETRRCGLETGKDPAVAQLILDESVAVLRQGTQLIVVEQRFGFVIAVSDTVMRSLGDRMRLARDVFEFADAIASTTARPVPWV